MKSLRLSLAIMLCLGVVSPLAALPPSVKMNEDRSVTFHLRNPNASKVLLALEGFAQFPMMKGENGEWTVSTPPLEPNLYGYYFVVDGVTMLDPMNAATKPNLLYVENILLLSGENRMPWEIAEVPHGVLHRHHFHSKVIGDERDYYVYTPPNYDPRARRRYPVLYLLHGYSDDASGWSAVGQAHVILDNLIAQGKAQPMLVVMPLGYGTREIIEHGWAGLSDSQEWLHSMTAFRHSLLDEIVPQVERDYRVRSDRDSRAIAGLSMGGAESLFTGLNYPDRFAWVGAFSSGGLNRELTEYFPQAGPQLNQHFRLLWITCGREDHLYQRHKEILAFLQQKSVNATGLETNGAHTWMVWRKNLVDFVPLLFQTKR
ncbi:MAG TPA: alpha/beta hydrolase-fold protein [Candidatus Acidoferrales bacterium]|nr:alpha/beta hydrolase-fold protein [Candidatus Acidoferrales bacterium]